MKCYLICENDEYKLPLVLAYSQREVAEYIGVTTRAIEMALQDKTIATCKGFLIERTEIID